MTNLWYLVEEKTFSSIYFHQHLLPCLGHLKGSLRWHGALQGPSFDASGTTEIQVSRTRCKSSTTLSRTTIPDFECGFVRNTRFWSKIGSLRGLLLRTSLHLILYYCVVGRMLWEKLPWSCQWRFDKCILFAACKRTNATVVKGQAMGNHQHKNHLKSMPL